MTIPLPWLSVELFACAWILVLLAADLLLPEARKASLWLWTLAGLGICAILLAGQAIAGGHHLIQQMFLVDPFSRFFKALFLGTAAVVVVMTRPFGRHLAGRLGAFYLLLFTAVLGMLVLASVHDLLMLFLGLELLTFSLYIMAAYLRTEARSIEAGMKYLILGSLSSGFLVYGMALLYGFAGSTHFEAIRHAFEVGPVPPIAVAGLLLVMAGLGFKIAAVPFHLWVPDVYEGAPTPVVALLSVGSKTAGVVALTRLLFGAAPTMAGLWTNVLAGLSAATMLYGNLGAIPQTNIKRLLGYSSIGHAGYLLMGLSAGSQSGVEAVSFYLVAYFVSNLAVFLAVTWAGEQLGSDELEQYNGLSKRSPFLAAALFIGFLSLAGVPPLAGFVGKLFVMLRAVESGRLWLVAIGAVNVAISLYYYLMVIKRMYLDAPPTSTTFRLDRLATVTLSLLLLGVLWLGIVQEPLVRQILVSVRP
ncbi:MAG: NADH-quinone oxidoreductase subunit N [Candidatus Omnitrophica bacterium CG11_big_fil_rev_8_21_14_0_20_63_9]|nr:MAG: NADH-quinone oxidoreductase subunit N [Candidatus Omnitrophica bacterium CG11_big_fil_rev_8_21_14_0_20_63_9]